MSKMKAISSTTKVAEDFEDLELNISRAGDYFRSLSYSRPEMGDDSQTFYMEAIEHPLTNQWQVQEVWSRPNTLTSSPEMLEEITPSKKGLVSMKVAIEKIGTFESSSNASKHVATNKPKDLKDTHVAAFAGLNGYVLDIHQRPHATKDGRVVTKGHFDPKVRADAQRNFSRPVKDLPATADTSLTRLFNTSSEVEDFTRVLNHKIDKAAWMKYKDCVKSPLSTLIAMQTQNYKRAEGTRLGGFLNYDDVAGVDQFKQEIKTARDGLAKLPFVSNKEDFETYFQTLELAYEVGYSMALMKKFEHTLDRDLDKAQELSNDVTKQAKVAIALAKKMGGNERNGKEINAIIVEGHNNLSRAERERLEAFNLTSSFGGERVHDGYALFIPEELVEFLHTLNKVTASFDKKIEAEKKRIIKPATAPDRKADAKAAPKASSSNEIKGRPTMK